MNIRCAGRIWWGDDTHELESVEQQLTAQTAIFVVGFAIPPEIRVLHGRLPSNPNQAYKNSGWVSFGDWLGTGRIATKISADPNDSLE